MYVTDKYTVQMFKNIEPNLLIGYLIGTVDSVMYWLLDNLSSVRFNCCVHLLFFLHFPIFFNFGAFKIIFSMDCLKKISYFDG